MKNTNALRRLETKFLPLAPLLIGLKPHTHLGSAVLAAAWLLRQVLS